MTLVCKWFSGNTCLAERHIDNAYWELPKTGVLQAVEQAARRVKKHGGMRGSFYFSIAKGGERLLDRVGCAIERHFRVIPLHDLLKFVKWDLYENTLFEWQGCVLNQNIKGVPIGGFLSAQLMYLLGLMQEINFIESPSPILDRVLLGWDKQCFCEIGLKPGPVLTFPSVAWVPKDTQVFNTSGMGGWFEPSWKHVGSLCVDSITIELRTLVLWDSHPEGRVGHIIQSAPRRQHLFLRNYFLNVDSLRCMLAESADLPEPMCSQPSILLTRYMDNTCVAFCNVPQHLLYVCRQFLVQLQAELYQVPFKWELEGQFLHLGGTCVSCTPQAPSLSLKGFTLHSFDPSIWDRWHDRSSPSCCLVLQSMVPALVLKSLIFGMCRAN